MGLPALKTVCAAGVMTPGIDIYTGDYIEDINKVLASGVKYIFNKAWEYQIDASLKSRWAALEGKVIRGAYDFFHPSRDPVTQANSFLSAINDAGGLKDTDLPPMLDWESTDSTSPQNDAEAGYAWLDHVQTITKRIPIIYAGPYFLQALRLDSRFKRFGLYVAEYGPKCPKIVGPWNDWQFWQTTGSGNVPGMRGPCDKDVFNGDFNALVAYIASTKVA